MASIRSIQNQQKISVYERVHMLSQKINSIPFSKSSDTAKRYQMIDQICDDLENQIEDFKGFFEQKMVDIKHLTAKISKQMRKDQSSTDSLIRQEIANSNERMLTMIQQQYEARKQSDVRIVAFIDEQSNLIRQIIQNQAGKREEQGNLIKQSLAADIQQIKRVLNETNLQNAARMQRAENQLFERTDNITLKLRQICTAYSDNQSEFYKMLRDIVKKVKAQLQDHQSKREQTQAEILNLIQKLCDKAMSEKHI